MGNDGQFAIESASVYPAVPAGLNSCCPSGTRERRNTNSTGAVPVVAGKNVYKHEGVAPSYGIRALRANKNLGWSSRGIEFCPFGASDGIGGLYFRISPFAVECLIFRQGDDFLISEDAAHGERLTGTERANTEIGVPGSC